MKIVLFDIDETLLTCPNKTNAQASEVMFKRIFNIDASENSINHTGKTQRGIIEEVVRKFKNLPPDQEVEVPNEAFQIWGETQTELLKKSPAIVLPGIRELLANLAKDSNIIMGILTGNCRFRTNAKLSNAGLKDYFLDNEGLIRGAFGDISNKRSDLIEEAKNKLGQGDYIIIDDSIIAGKMAQEKNIPAILVATGKATKEELKQYSKYVFKDFGENKWQEVIKIIEGMPD